VFKSVQKSDSGVDYNHLKDLIVGDSKSAKQARLIVVNMYKHFMIKNQEKSKRKK